MTQPTASTNRPGLAVILASVRDGRFGPVIASWLLRQVQADGYFNPVLIDLAETLPDTAFAQAVYDAAAIVIVTPEYNHSFPGQLKVAIDGLGPEWRAKPVGFVSYGGLSGGLRSVEALRLVLAELDAVPVRNTVSLHSAAALFDEHGELIDPDPAGDALLALLDALAWWSAALRDALKARPFGTREAGPRLAAAAAENS
jgi:NAD(P)H-dependent FMN reductase